MTLSYNGLPAVPLHLLLQVCIVTYIIISCLSILNLIFNCTCRTGRECSEDITVKGFTFPKGLAVQIPIYYIQNNPEYWPEPDKFDPNR